MEKDRPKEEAPEDALKREFFQFLEQKSIPFIDFLELKISRLELLGTGGFSKVYKGLFLKNPVAIKEYLDINLFEGRQNDVSCFSILKEISKGRSLNFPKFNRCYGVSLSSQGSLFTVHDLAESSLRKKLKEGSLTTIQQKNDIAEQILQIMLTLQKRKVIHRDLKPANFLLTASGEVHICDFGSIRKIKNGVDETKSMNRNFTVKYAPPEFIVQENGKIGEVGLYSDIWSLGIILFEIYYDKPFWGNIRNDMVMGKIFDKTVPQAKESKDVPSEITSIVNGALVYEGKNRIKIMEVIELFEKAKANFKEKRNLENKYQWKSNNLC